MSARGTGRVSAATQAWVDELCERMDGTAPEDVYSDLLERFKVYAADLPVVERRRAVSLVMTQADANMKRVARERRKRRSPDQPR